MSGGACRIRFLADRIGVSEQTERRNVRMLESNSRVRQGYGGVQLIEAQSEDDRVFLAGGKLPSHDGGRLGKSTIEFIAQFNVQYAGLSVGAINAESRFMLRDHQEAAVSRKQGHEHKPPQ